jgi:hypothetical protein
MAGKELVICIHNQRIYFNPDLSIPIENTNIPKESFVRHKHKQFLWKVELTSYLPLEKCLNVRLLEYESDRLDKFHEQAPKNEKEIEKLFFENPDWSDLGMVLLGYTKMGTAPPPQKILPFETTEFLFKRRPESVSKEFIQIKETSKKIEEQFWIDISDVQFKLGYVTLSKKIEGVNDKVEFKIINEHILAEFDNIKFWFAKVLKTRRIKVIATVTIKGNTVIDSIATSLHIDKITPELIDSVKYQRTFGLTKPSKIKAIDKSLFTAEDIFDQFESDAEGNTFNQTDIEILSFLSDKPNIRNKKQLQYLAGGKQTERQKLRFTLHPNFGFVFLIEGEKNNHFVWELLNSHATYVWSIGKSESDITIQYKRIEASINNVRTAGREEYKRAYRSSHQDPDLVFNVIEHNHANSNLIDGFVRWKSKLNEMLI